MSNGSTLMGSAQEYNWDALSRAVSRAGPRFSQTLCFEGEAMRSVRFVSLFLILGSVMLAAQSKPGLSQPDPKTQGNKEEPQKVVPPNLSRIAQVAPLAPRRNTRFRATGVRRSLPMSGALFAPSVAYDSGGRDASSVTVGDVNGDGKADLVVANACSPSKNCNGGTVAVLLGNGDGTFQGAVAYSSGGYDANWVAVGDVNGDGKPDLLVVNQCADNTCANGNVAVLLGNGDGTFQGAVAYGSGGDEARSVAVGDVNGDDKLDLLVANQCVDNTCGTNGTVGVLINISVPMVTLSPPGLNFGNQTVGITSNPQISTLMNTGNRSLTLKSIGITGTNSSDFAQTNNCGASVPPNGSCQISVTFTPTATGTRNAAVRITDNAPDSPQTLPLSGVGVLPAVMFSPARLTFPDQVVFTSSRARPITLTNNGLGTLLISEITAKSPFSQTNNCPKSVAPGAKCTISVKFDPGNKGVFQGAVSVTDNAPDSPQEVALKGTGTFVQLAPPKVNFGTQPVGTRSGRRKITLTNKGDGAVNIKNISITGADARDFFETNNCGKSVPSGASCLIEVTFKPLVKGKRTADVSVSDDGGGSPQKAGLVGTGT
jgi:hypothetical protein